MAGVLTRLRKLIEAGGALNMSYAKLTGDYSEHNYSSGKMEDAPYWSDRDNERQAMEAKVFNPLLYTFLDFARFAIPALAAFKGRWWQLKHAWQYDARPTPDPVKDATGDALNLQNATDTLADIAARAGTSLAEIEDLTNSLAHFGTTTTSMILSSPISWRNVFDRD